MLDVPRGSIGSLITNCRVGALALTEWTFDAIEEVSPLKESMW